MDFNTVVTSCDDSALQSDVYFCPTFLPPAVFLYANETLWFLKDDKNIFLAVHSFFGWILFWDEWVILSLKSEILANA